jgi:hypothetical protein
MSRRPGARGVSGTYRRWITSATTAATGATRKPVRQPRCSARRLPIAGIGVVSANPAPRYSPIAAARRCGGNTALMVASERPSRKANATPEPARAAISTAPVGAAAARMPKPIAPSRPPVNIRFMP